MWMVVQNDSLLVRDEVIRDEIDSTKIMENQFNTTIQVLRRV